MTWGKGGRTDYKKYPLLSIAPEPYEHHKAPDTAASLNAYGLHQEYNTAYGLHG